MVGKKAAKKLRIKAREEAADSNGPATPYTASSTAATPTTVPATADLLTTGPLAAASSAPLTTAPPPAASPTTVPHNSHNAADPATSSTTHPRDSSATRMLHDAARRRRHDDEGPLCSDFLRGMSRVQSLADLGIAGGRFEGLGDPPPPGTRWVDRVMESTASGGQRSIPPVGRCTGPTPTPTTAGTHRGRQTSMEGGSCTSAFIAPWSKSTSNSTEGTGREDGTSDGDLRASGQPVGTTAQATNQVRSEDAISSSGAIQRPSGDGASTPSTRATDTVQAGGATSARSGTSSSTTQTTNTAPLGDTSSSYARAQVPIIVRTPEVKDVHPDFNKRHKCVNQ